MIQDRSFIAGSDILVIDDSPTNLSLLTQILSDKGYKVRVATNGKLGRQSASATPPDLILLDIMMPSMDGYEICEQLKADELTRDIPVIFLSGLNEALDKVQAFAVGGVDYVTKPFEPLEILARSENQLRWRSLELQLKEQNAQLQLLLTTTQGISKAANVDSALKVILSKICQTIGWNFAEAWLPNLKLKALVCSRGWYASDSSLLLFRQLSQALTFPPNVGLPGRVWLSKKPAWIEDISQTNARSFLRDKIAAAVGIKAALGVPIIVGYRVFAVLVFLHKNQITPDGRLIELVNGVATQLGALIQRKKAETALKKANQELERLAALDGLTSVANRRQFDKILQQEWYRLKREQLPLSLIMCDVDYFKCYNDRYGHMEGDNCLRQVASAIASASRRPANLVARYGGEEFAVILPNTSAEAALKVAELIRNQVQQLKIPHALSNASQYVSLSLGVSTIVPTGDSSPLDLIEIADLALYSAKQQGRNCAVARSYAIATK
ncbi:diguanylate cyclase domain-containing protein [Microseira sp. BLCC-F43]|jgi:diguanylate cyclase (GGDEF)-like protein|uniref:diguanylate cyclase domain-containing protein n=1 Tax=Microseira sp. BLCC-F43 TaxID=3153602 RepID=UPI0035BB3AFE